MADYNYWPVIVGVVLAWLVGGGLGLLIAWLIGWSRSERD